MHHTWSHWRLNGRWESLWLMEEENLDLSFCFEPANPSAKDPLFSSPFLKPSHWIHPRLFRAPQDQWRQLEPQQAHRAHSKEAPDVPGIAQPQPQQTDRGDSRAGRQAEEAESIWCELQQIVRKHTQRGSDEPVQPVGLHPQQLLSLRCSVHVLLI